ncbi:hypothetical protein [Desulfurococcus amylolyticus]|uniref:Uncharacterized protein n=1 Tax=Desulfurococcus amylolyticus DSM 16532 TaxID=768672 RepID=I3XSH5_DESAM|nr:hypothetical protein [Desulfurococcus amylolyticus]AFL66899.1 hypothetical protein Desfe_1017 [Desulfurococcus amylolyticus DSM 16532]
MSTPITQLSEIVDILAFLGALGDYGYIDRLGNAIDEVTFMEAIRDSIRAYYTNCLDEKKCVEYDKTRKAGVLCLDLKSDQLEKIVNSILDTISNVSKVDIIKLSRKIALEAYAKIPVVREKQGCKTE